MLWTPLQNAFLFIAMGSKNLGFYFPLVKGRLLTVKLPVISTLLQLKWERIGQHSLGCFSCLSFNYTLGYNDFNNLVMQTL
jgi:hypothetical protein